MCVQIAQVQFFRPIDNALLLQVLPVGLNIIAVNCLHAHIIAPVRAIGSRPLPCGIGYPQGVQLLLAAIPGLEEHTLVHKLLDPLYIPDAAHLPLEGPFFDFHLSTSSQTP